MKLSVIIPVYNEADTLSKVIKKVKDVQIDSEIIIVDDGSTDGTRKILKDITEKEHKGLQVIFHERNMGKGSAVKTGVKYAKGNFVIIQDADLEYDPNEYSKLLDPLIKKEADVVFGSRLLNRSPKGNLFFWLGRISITWVANILYKSHLTDAYTCYKVFPRDFIKRMKITSRGFELEAELTSKTLLEGKKIIEIPISYNPRSTKGGKKISWKDWFRGVIAFLKFRYTMEK